MRAYQRRVRNRLRGELLGSCPGGGHARGCASQGYNEANVLFDHHKHINQPLKLSDSIYSFVLFYEVQSGYVALSAATGRSSFSDQDDGF